ncbi:MAG: N-acetylmuramoyl-L-alanine amidase [Lachnospiraceae bacterium]|nr:N-acetylmuramoyl-L-alanine amidase [bacterium]MDY5517685.1 N-acetylmuramoyl-L-alanine amidase [Lachnospiraceae bacterium]
MKKKIELCMAVLVLLAAALLGRQGAKLVNSAKSELQERAYQVVIDVGHGGIDSGKVSADGILEKDVNLVIAKKLKALLEQEDVCVTLTRDSDTGLYHEGDSNKKVADLQNRCALIEKIDPDCTVSIHQNSFSSPEVKGAQVFFYGQSEEGENLAKLIQESLIERADPQNHRQAKANESYYLLKRTVSPTVIVECGFLSNPQEAELLTDEDYQNRLVWAIHMGVMEFLYGAYEQKVE